MNVSVQSNVFFSQLFELFLKMDRGRMKIKQLVKFRTATKFNRALSEYKNDLVLIGSGSYANVFRSNGMILKLIRLLPSEVCSRVQCSSIARTTRYIDAFNEYSILLALSKLQLRSITIKNRPYRCHIFPRIIGSYLINDNIEPYIKNLNTYENFGSYSDIFDDYFLKIPKENLVIVMEDCGELLTDMIDQLSPHTLLSVLKQTIIGLMIAERALEFEHRDLHSGNVMLQRYSEDVMMFKCENQSISLPSHGYRVKIIDTTFSRMKYKNMIYYKDMTSLFENFQEKKLERLRAGERREDNGEGGNQIKMQDWIYEQMAKVVGNDWKSFYPKTNLLWIKYVIHKLKQSLSSRTIPPKTTAANNAVPFRRNDLCRIQYTMEQFNRLMDKCSDLTECFRIIIGNPSINDLVVITCSEN